jgi:hypothetical protein
MQYINRDVDILIHNHDNICVDMNSKYLWNAYAVAFSA